jgi:hypothetical protein
MSEKERRVIVEDQTNAETELAALRAGKTLDEFSGLLSVRRSSLESEG